MEPYLASLAYSDSPYQGSQLRYPSEFDEEFRNWDYIGNDPPARDWQVRKVSWPSKGAWKSTGVTLGNCSAVIGSV